MLMTNDACQDDWAVACGKFYFYQNHLPAHVDKAESTADGAGSFKPAIQGIDEIVYRITPAGDGCSPTELDWNAGCKIMEDHNDSPCE
jgi:hypothetical protein